MAGLIVLCGGNEFEDESISLNKAMLAAVKGKKPRLLVLPIASTDNPRKATKRGVGYFNKIGTWAESTMIVNAETANDPAMSAPMETADIIFLTDGNPFDAVEGLASSEALAKLTRAWDKGAVLAASGAAAMALCDHYWDSGNWEKGLGVLKGIVVIPHYEHVAGRFSPERLRQNLPEGYTILGLDDSTGVLISAQQVKVAGPEVVTVIGPEGEQEYTEGQSFQLGD